MKQKKYITQKNIKHMSTRYTFGNTLHDILMYWRGKGEIINMNYY